MRSETPRMNVASGVMDMALVVGGSVSPKGAFGTTRYEEFDATDLDSQRFRIIGVANYTGFAMQAVRRMHDYGLTEADLALQKAKASKFGSLNPNARFRKIYTVEEVLASPMVAYPMHLYEMCATSDGAAAMVVCSLEEATKIYYQAGNYRRYRGRLSQISGPGFRHFRQRFFGNSAAEGERSRDKIHATGPRSGRFRAGRFGPGHRLRPYRGYGNTMV